MAFWLQIAKLLSQHYKGFSNKRNLRMTFTFRKHPQTTLTSKGKGGGLPNVKVTISLFSKLVNEGGREGVKIPQNSVDLVYGCPLHIVQIR